MKKSFAYRLLIVFFFMSFWSFETSAQNTSCPDIHRGIASVAEMTRYASVAKSFDICKTNVEYSVKWIKWIFENKHECTCPASYKYLQNTWKYLYSLDSNNDLSICRSQTKKASKNSASSLFYISQCYKN